MNWNLIKLLGIGAKAVLPKIPLHPALKTRRVRFADVPIHPTRGVFIKLATGSQWVRVSHDEACPLDPDWQRHIRYQFNNPDEPVDLVLQKHTV